MIIRLLILFSLFNYTVVAQDARIQWDYPLQEFKKTNSLVIGSDTSDKCFYFLKELDGKFTLQKFTSENVLVFERELTFGNPEEIKDNTYSVYRCLMLRDRFIVLIIAIEKKTAIATVFLQDVTFEGKLIGGKKSVQQFSSSTRGSFHLFISPDSTKIVEAIVIPKQKGFERNQMSIKVQDADLKELSSRKVFFSAEEDKKYKRVQIEFMVVDNAGNIYLAGKKFLTNVNRELALWHLAKDGDNLDPLKVDMIGKWTDQYSLRMNSLGEPVLAGLFSSLNEKHHLLAGYFYGKIEAGQAVDLKTYPIAPELQHPPYSTDAYEPSLTIIEKRDGGLILIFEYIWFKSNNPHFGYLFVLNLDSEGSLVYGTPISKNQSKYLGVFRQSSYFNYYSYMPLYDNEVNKLYLLFSDNPKNLKKSTSDAPALLLNISNSVLVSAEIDRSGAVSRKLVDAPGNEIFFCTGLRVELGKGEYGVVGYKSNEFWLGRLSMK